MLVALFLHRMSTKRRISLKQRDTSSGLQKSVLGSDYCRTCLATEGLMSIFCDKETEEKRSRDLQLVTGLEIKSNDGLSQKICTQCAEAIDSCLRFRRVSRKAERALLKMAEGAPKVRKKYSLNLKKSHNSHSPAAPVKSSNRIQKDVKPVKSELDISVEPANDNYDYDNDHFDDLEDYKEDIKTESIKQEARPRKQRARLLPATSYACAICHKVFRMKATYKAHMRFHTNFCVCESCGKRCRNNNQLQEHKRARHGLGRIHKCAYCEYSSATKEALTIHERRHTGERPYVCDHCGATFHRRSNLVQHIAIHLPEKNWQCDMCPKRLKSKKFLQIHKHNAHTGKRYGYLCSICAHRFEKPNKVRAHTRRVHGVPDDQQGPITRVQL